MKHSIKITLLLVLLFLASHIMGFFIIQNYLPAEQSLPLNIEKPEFEEQTSFIQIAIIILFATIFILLLLKFKAVKLFKAWYFISIFVTLVIAFGAFIYGGLAALFVPVLNIFSAVILLIIISVYDMIAVWKTKHMVSLAKFQAGSGAFAGLSIPYNIKGISKNVSNKIIRSKTESIAILGGGDIGFPLMLSGAVMKYMGLIPALIVSLFAAIALFCLFVFAKKKKFYPAIPFISAGCF